MTLEQRAQQFWSVLVFAAREQKLISYSRLSQMTGFCEPAGPVLHYIYCYCKQHELPALNAIVIDAVTGQPGDECPGDFIHRPAQQSQVFLYDWLQQPAPSEDDFAHAMARELEELELANAEFFALPC